MSRSRRTQSDKRDAVSLVFAFFLSVLLVGETILLVGLVGFLTKTGFKLALDDTYYEYNLNYINDQARYYTMPTGIDPAVLEGVFTFDDVKDNVTRYVDSVYSGDSFGSATMAWESTLKDNVTKLIGTDGQNEEIATEYVKGIKEVYVEAIKIPGLTSIVQARDRFMKYALLGMTVLAVLVAILLVLIFRLHHYPHRALRFVAYATGGAALMELVLPGALLIAKPHKGLRLNPEYFYHLGVNLVDHALITMLLGGVLFLIVTVILIVCVSRMRKHSMVSKHHHHHH